MDQTAVPPEQLTTDEVAQRVGVERETWRKYVGRGDAPQPAGYVGRTPWWTPEQVETWLAARPGRGTGGGRPVGFSPKPRKSA